MENTQKLPRTPLSSSVIANFLSVSKPTISEYYRKIRRAYYWLPEEELVTGNGNKRKYLPFCVAQMESLSSSPDHELWITNIQKSRVTNPESIQEQPPGTQAEVFEAELMDIPQEVALTTYVEPTSFVQELKFQSVTVDLSHVSQTTASNLARMDSNVKTGYNALRERLLLEARMQGTTIAHEMQAETARAISDEMEKMAHGGIPNA
jgi:hypothetical protein